MSNTEGSEHLDCRGLHSPGPPYLSPHPVCPRAGSPRPVLGKKSAVLWRVHTGVSPPQLLHPHASLPHFPTWFRVLCDFCIQARHWSYKRKLRFEQYACFLSQPRNCLSSRRTGPELGSPPRGSHTPPPGPGRSKENGAAVSGRGRQEARAGRRPPIPDQLRPGKVGKGVRCGPSVTQRDGNATVMETGKALGGKTEYSVGKEINGD